MDITTTKQKININSANAAAAKTNSSKTAEKPFADELKTAKGTKETDSDKKEKTEEVNVSEQTGEAEKETEEKTNTTVDEAIDGLQDVVNEFNKIGQKDELDDNFIKAGKNFADRKNKFSSEDYTLIDNNMNIQEPSDKLNVQTEANMNFNSSEQPFSEFVNKNSSKNGLNTSAKELAEEQAILSTMEENIAIANKNMLVKEKTATVQNETGIKKVDTKSHLTVDIIVSYENVVMDKNDVDFFVNLVNNGVINLSEVQGAEKSSKVSKTLADLLAKAMNDNKPVRIDFDNDISVIIKIDRAGKISADFLPSSQVAEAYLKENLPLLKQRFDENNIDYNELNQRKQKQDSQDNNRKKGQKDE